MLHGFPGAAITISAAGQEVLHVHLHVISRYKTSWLKWWGKNQFKGDEQKKELLDTIKKEL